MFTGISCVYFIKLRVCHNKGSKRNNVLKNCAEISKAKMGWFFGFKQHLIVND
jgi:hypothetical protein